MSTQNPCNTDDWAKPALHPCKREFQDIKKGEWDKDYEDLLNLVQRHTHYARQHIVCANSNKKMKFHVGLISPKNVVTKHTYNMKN